MKKNTLWVLTLFAGICLLLFACRRDIDNYIHDRDSAPSMTLESAKIWYLQHLETDGIEKLKPLWEDGWTLKSTSGKTLILVPAPEQHIDNPDVTARRFFVFTANGSNVSDGRIVELIGNKYTVNDNFDLLLKNYDRNEIAGFNGSILSYDVNYHFVYSTSFSNGKKNDHDARIVTGDMNALKSNKVLAGRPGLKANDYCTPVQPMNHSFPGSSAPEGCVFVWHQDVVTSGGCIISIHNYYLYTYCPNAGTSGTGSGSGSGSGSGGSSGNTGMGGPPSNPPVITYASNLTTQFPCIVSTVLMPLLNIPQYQQFTNAFNTNIKPDLTWDLNATLPWSVPSNASTAGFNATLAETKTDRAPTNVIRDAKIYFNPNLLQNSSKLLIASTAIHETLHAYINYTLKSVTAGFVQPQNYDPTLPWLFALDTYIYTLGLPSNYTDHRSMLISYFNQSVNILKTYDNSNHTDKQYAMLMLYGLNTGDLAPLQNDLNQLFADVKAAYKITSTTELTNYWLSQLNAPTNEKLPTNGCP